MQHRQSETQGNAPQQATNTLFLGDLDQRVDLQLLHELCLQVTAASVGYISVPGSPCASRRPIAPKRFRKFDLCTAALHLGGCWDSTMTRQRVLLLCMTCHRTVAPVRLAGLSVQCSSTASPSVTADAVIHVDASISPLKFRAECSDT